MCILAIAWQAHPRWRLVVAANRDERHDRAADPLARWHGSAVIAGRDRVGGGTWLGVAGAGESGPGRFAAVTNLRGFGVPQPGRPSRGRLVADLVAGRGADGAPGLERYGPFNAVAIAGGEGSLLSNRPGASCVPLPPGLHAVSNGPLASPWRKTTRLTAMLRHWLDDPDGALPDLFAALRDPAPPAGTDEDPTAIFVDDPVYGTRCSTLVAIDRAGAGTILERRYDAQARAVGDTAIGFDW